MKGGRFEAVPTGGRHPPRLLASYAMSAPTERERDEELLAQLDEGTARLLFPEKFAAEALRVSLLCPPLQDDLAAAAEEYLAAAVEVETVDDPAAVGDGRRLRATFELSGVEELHGLFTLLDEEYGPNDLEVLVDGHRLPLVRELWLPLLWALRD